jgi:aryl-alcohol dehydrogenase-like predicted oxidoreductase
MTTDRVARGVDYRRLGSSGLKISNIGLGMMSYGDAALQAWALPEDRATRPPIHIWRSAR